MNYQTEQLIERLNKLREKRELALEEAIRFIDNKLIYGAQGHLNYACELDTEIRQIESDIVEEYKRNNE